MIQAVQRYLRTALRFPKRDVVTLRWIRTGSIVGGVFAIVQVFLWFGKWIAWLWVLMVVLWCAQAAFATKEVRRGEDQTPGA